MTRESHRQRELLGVRVTVQLVALVVTTLALTALVGLAVLRWLESTT